MHTESGPGLFPEKALINNAGKMAQNGNPARFNLLNFKWFIKSKVNLTWTVQAGCQSESKKGATKGAHARK